MVIGNWYHSSLSCRSYAGYTLDPIARFHTSLWRASLYHDTEYTGLLSPCVILKLWICANVDNLFFLHKP